MGSFGEGVVEVLEGDSDRHHHLLVLPVFEYDGFIIAICIGEDLM